MQSANNDFDLRGAIYDDMTIAEGLLNNSKVPHRTSSFTGAQGLARSTSQLRSSMALTDASVRGISRRAGRTSNTWTSSDGEVLSDHDEVDDRTVFVQEFNRLARKHGVRPMVVEDDEPANDDSLNVGHRDSWFSRKILRRTSSTQSVKPERQLKHRRSISDLSLRMKKRDKLKDKDLQELVRLCGSSLLYLPAEYAAGSLAVPTCFRATAQYLVQYGTTTRGVFRIPGSYNVVAALYNHYCSMDQNGEAIAGTVRCPTLPEHIQCDVHDVASAFKRFISGLPGGILGSLPLFDSLISIQSQLHSDPEWTRTKHSKVRARLIALAIATLRSQYRRELICAVFGLLCMIGRAAETSRREDDRGRPLPTSDLMGYGPLGIIFGPLLVGDLLEDYTMRLANPHGGLILLPISPPKSRKERKKKTKSGEEGSSFNTYVDKIKVANSIAEMLITHWRDVVRHMKNLSALKIIGGHKSLGFRGTKPPFLRPSASETFAIRKPPDWDDRNPIRPVTRSPSPTPMRRVSSPAANANTSFPFGQGDDLKVRKRRSTSRPLSTPRLSTAKSLSVLSPTAEEISRENESTTQDEPFHMKEKSNASSSSNKENKPPPADAFKEKVFPRHSTSQSPCSASKGKSTTLHAQPIDHLKYMEPNLSLMTGIPMEVPKRVQTLFHEPAVQLDKGKAADRVLRQNKPSNSGAHDNSGMQPQHTLLKPLFPSPPPSSGPKKLGPVAWAKKSLSRKSRTSQDTSDSPLNQKKPKVLISRASTREFEQEMPKDQRRLRGSDPGIRAKTPERSPRKVSRSLYDNPQRKRKPFELYYAKKFPRKDPLSTISQEEDIASLAELAQALDFLEEQDRANSPSQTATAKQEPRNIPGAGKRFTLPDQTREASKLNNIEFPNPVAQGQGPTVSLPAKTEKIRAVEDQPTSFLGLKSQVASLEAKPAFPLTPKRTLANTTQVTSKSPINRQRTPIGATPSNPPGSPSTKFSALVAKFNNPDIQPSPERSPSRPPKKSLTEFLAGENQKRIGSPKEGLVAPYTTNPPSPTRSQKSSRSVITPQSRRSSLVSSRKILLDATLNLSRRASLAGKGEDPIRAASTTPHGTPTPRQSPTSLRASPLGCRKSPCPLEYTSPTEQNQSNQLSEVSKFPISAQKQVKSATSGLYEPSSTGCSTSPEHAIEHVTVCAMKIPTSILSYVPPATVFNSPTMASTELPTLDGPSGAIDIKKLPISFGPAEGELSRIKSSPSLVDRPGFVHPESPFMDVFTTSRPATPGGSPPLLGRSNSVLYAQIRTLQRQLATKSEEVRHLKKKLDARGGLDIGTLSEQLREAKKETQLWKSRAERAEKQVEIFTKLPLRPRSRQPSADLDSSAKSTRTLARSSTGYPGEAAEMAARIRKALHGMDGTSSPPCWSSEESSDTVIRDPLNGSGRII